MWPIQSLYWMPQEFKKVSLLWLKETWMVLGPVEALGNFLNHCLETVVFSEIVLTQPHEVSPYTRAFRNSPPSEHTWRITTEEHTHLECGKPYSTGASITEQKMKRSRGQLPWESLDALSIFKRHEDLFWRESLKPSIFPHSLNCENSLQKNLWV